MGAMQTRKDYLMSKKPPVSSGGFSFVRKGYIVK